MSATQKIICACGCGREKIVRTVDVKRGWGKYFDKSCKARHQKSRTGQRATYFGGRESDGLFQSNFNDDKNDILY